MSIRLKSVGAVTPTRSVSKTNELRSQCGLRDALALWHLLSLDAPTIAVIWTCFIAEANHISLSLSLILAMGIAVWMLYAADRLLDTRLIDISAASGEGGDECIELEERHYFHHRHRGRFYSGILLASIALAVLLPQLDADVIRLYLILGGLLSGFFILIHASLGAVSKVAAHCVPKELAVGFFFAAATFIPSVARRPDLRLVLFLPALQVAMLCSLNCVFIYGWEHPLISARHPPHATTHFALRHLSLLTNSVILLGVTFAVVDRSSPWPIPVASALGGAFLFLLHLCRTHMEPITRRSAADLALTTPLIFLPFLHR